MSHSRTVATRFVGKESVTDQKTTLEKWYQGALTDEDAALSPEERFYYQGLSDGLSDALKLLYGMGVATAEVVVEETKKGRRFKKPLIILGVGAGIYVLWNYQEIKTKIKEQNQKLRAQAIEDDKIDRLQGKPSLQ
jgi:hypothetical protein